MMHKFFVPTLIKTLLNCQHEDANSRLMINVADCVKCGHWSVAIRTVGTDAVAISLAIAADLDIAFGTGKAFRYIGVHSIVQNIGIHWSKTLALFHSLTGFGTVLSFAGHGNNFLVESGMSSLR